MLTPDKIKEKTFQTSGRGAYRADDVDNFKAEVSSSYEQMFKENADLIRKITILAKKVEEYREDEDSLKMALINAQKLADKIVAEAKENSEAEAKKIVDDAKAKTANADADAQKVLLDAKSQAESILENAKSEAEKIVKDANAEANDKLGNVNRQITHKTLEFDMLKKEASKFKSDLKSMYERHITLINQLPELAEEASDAAEDGEYATEEVDLEVAAKPEEETPAEEVVEAVIETAEEETDEEPAFEIIPSNEYETISEEDEEDEIEESSDSAISFDEEESQITFITENDEDEQEEKDSYFEAEEPAKNKFQLDLSKIDFSDDEQEAPSALSHEKLFPEFEEEELEENDDDDDSSNSFKNFFKKKK